MRFIIVTFGSEGDVRPYIALARELQSFHQEAAIATTRNNFKLITDFGIEFIPLKGYNGRSTPSYYFRFIKTLRSSIVNEEGYLMELWNVCQHADVIIYNVATFPCLYVAEKLGVPNFGAFMQPHHLTRAFPDPSVTSGKPLGGIFNLAGFWLFDILHWLYVRKSINKWRKETLKLPKIPVWDTVLRQMKQKKSCILYAYSPALLPRPAEWRSDRLEVTGYWYLDLPLKDYTPPGDLDHFLNSGPPPVFISVMWNIGKFSKENLVEISNRSNSRLLIQDLYGEMQGMIPTEKVFYIKGSIPHQWLFKKVSVAIHHGGLGICMNCIRAGLPMIAIPADIGGNDHRFWAYQVARSGVGIHLPASNGGKLFVRRLVSAIKRITDNDDLRANAEELSKKAGAENGIQNAIEYLFKEIAKKKNGPVQNALASL